jgi:hypothetical protein
MALLGEYCAQPDILGSPMPHLGAETTGFVDCFGTVSREWGLCDSSLGMAVNSQSGLAVLTVRQGYVAGTGAQFSG